MANGGSEKYRKANRLDYLGDFPGARRERDRIVVEVHEGEIDVINRSGRTLGKVEVTELPEPIQTVLYEALASEGEDAIMVRSDKPLDVSAETVEVKQKDTVEVEQSETFQVKESRSLDVSGATVDVQEDEPLDVSGATVSVQEDEALDVSGAEVEVDLTSQSLSELAANISQIGGEAQSAVDVANAIDEIHGALESVGDTTVRVSSPSALDVSAETVTIQEEDPVETSVTGVPEVKKEENYGVSIENDYEAELDVGNYSLVDVAVNSDANTKITIEKSWDEDTWFTVVDEDDTDNLIETLRGAGGQYYRATLKGTGSSGDEADIVIAAKSR